MKNLRIVLITAFIIGVVGVQLKWKPDSSSSSKPAQATLNAHHVPKTAHMMVAETCGACHANTHVRPAGDYALNSADFADNPGIVGQTQGIANPFVAPGSDPLGALVIQKPMEGSVTPHGGIKISSSHPTMQALIEIVRSESGLPGTTRSITDLNPPASAIPAYANALGAGVHEIVYARRTFRNDGFKSIRNYSAGGGLYRARFWNNAGSGMWELQGGAPTLIVDGTTVGGLLDVQQPSLSLDAQKIVFACRLQSHGVWTICEVNVDGSGFREITQPRTRNTGQGNSHDVNPHYLPYTPEGHEAIDTGAGSGAGGIIFLSDQPGFRDEYNTTQTLSLHVADKDGGNVRQLDFNPSHNLEPWMHSSGLVVYTRWEHNEHQGDNFMSLFAMTASDYMTAGTNQFGVFGEHNRIMGNSTHESSEILDATYGQTATNNLLIGDANGLINPPIPHSKMVYRSSGRDDMGGDIIGPIFPRLQGERNGPRPTVNVMLIGDDVEQGEDNMMMGAQLSSVTYRTPMSMIQTPGNEIFTVSMSTLVDVEFVFDSFAMETNTVLTYGDWWLAVASVTYVGGEPKLHNVYPILQEAGFHYEGAIPLVTKPVPPKIGKPVDLNSGFGVFTSGNITNRQRDRQARGFSASDISAVRFIRAIQFSQGGSVNTGQSTEDGIPAAIVGDVPISSDGSFAAEIPANVPLQFQLLDNNGAVLVNHKPWLNVQPGETARCVGCHAPHNHAAKVQSLVARAPGTDPIRVDGSNQNVFHFHQDIQPILDNHCISCHDSALVGGAAGRDKKLDLVGRWIPPSSPGGQTVTASYVALVGGMNMSGAGGYVISQRPLLSKLIWWLTGIKTVINGAGDVIESAYPDPAALVDHTAFLSEENLRKILDWIAGGRLFRNINNDRDDPDLIPLNRNQFTGVIWPIFEANCMPCHDGSAGGEGAASMNLDGLASADSESDIITNRLGTITQRTNFINPGASPIINKPAVNGVSHGGGAVFAGITDPNYQAIYQWILATNPQLAGAGPLQTDLVSVTNYPNPFRDSTSFVYRLTGFAANKVEIDIYSKSGQLVRELRGPITGTSDITLGWNKVDWDGKDDNGKTVANDVYFYVVKAEFGDGTKKKFTGKCVKVE